MFYMLAKDMTGKDVKIYNSEDFPKDLPRLSELYDKLFSDGKGFRGQMVSVVGNFVSLSDREKLLLSQTVEFIHNSSLLHDDLIDQAPMRRGKTAIWKEFGPEYAVLAGDYLLARVMVNLSKNGHIGLVQVTAESIGELLEGEWLQDSIRFAENVSSEKMKRIHELKTSSLFSWCLKAPYILKNYPKEVIEKLASIGANMGLLLQRSDDLLDFNIRNFEGKTSFTDLKAGFLNSFSIHVFSDLKWTDDFYKIENEADLAKFVSKDLLAAKLESFDEINKKLILDIEKQAQALTDQDPAFAELQSMITEMAPRLYWRE